MLSSTMVAMMRAPTREMTSAATCTLVSSSLSSTLPTRSAQPSSTSTQRVLYCSVPSTPLYGSPTHVYRGATSKRTGVRGPPGVSRVVYTVKARYMGSSRPVARINARHNRLAHARDSPPPVTVRLAAKPRPRRRTLSRALARVLKRYARVSPPCRARGG